MQPGPAILLFLMQKYVIEMTREKRRKKTVCSSVSPHTIAVNWERFSNIELHLGTIVYTYIAEAGELLRIQGQLGLYNKYQASQDLIVRPYLINK